MRHIFRFIGFLMVSLITIATAATASAKEYFEPCSWMMTLPNSMQISQINLPGTHDSGTADVHATIPAFAYGGTCQEWDIRSQMKMGIRVFDMRFGASLNEADRNDMYKLQLNHGGMRGQYTYVAYKTVAKLPISLKNALEWAETFLTDNPSETIIYILTAEDDMGDRRLGDDSEEEAQKRKDIARDQLTKQLIPLYKYDGARNVPFKRCVSYANGDPVPVLGKVRGKCVLLYDDDASYTNYEMNYKDYPDDNIYPDRKIRLLQQIVEHPHENKWLQDYSGNRDNFVETQMRNFNPWGSAEKKIGNPQSPKICGTNITTIHDAASGFIAWAEKTGPKQLAEKVFAGFKYTDKEWPAGYRYGWITMDFPPESTIRRIAESNFDWPAVIYSARFSGLPAGKLISLDLEVKGIEERLSWKIDTENDIYEASGIVHTKDGAHRTCDPDTIFAVLRNPVIDGTLYRVVRKRVVIPAEKITTVPMGVKYVIQELIHLVPAGDWTLAEGTVNWIAPEGDKDTEQALRPVDLKEFSRLCGNLVWESVDSEGNRTVQSLSGSEPETEAHMTLESNGDNTVWKLTAWLPKNDPYGKPYKHELTGVDAISGSNPYKWEHLGNSTVDMQFAPQIFRKSIAEFVWIDGNDKYGARKYAKEILLDGSMDFVGVYNNVKGDDPATQTFWGPLTAENHAAFVENDTAMEADIKQFILKDGFVGSLKGWESYWNWFTAKDTHYNHKRESNVYTFDLYANVTVNIHWRDGDDAAGLRGDRVEVTVIDSATGVQVARTLFASSDVKEKNLWSSHAEVPLFHRKNDDPASITEVNFDTFTFKASRPDLYETAVEVTRVTDEYGVPAFVIDATYTLKDPEHVIVDGHIIWNDGGLPADHAVLSPKIRLMENGAEWKPGEVRLELSKNREEFTFEPYTSIPTRKSDGLACSYAVTADPLEIYPLVNVVGFDVYYTRTVGISGTVKWKDSGHIPTAQQPEVRLLMNGEDTGSIMTCENYAYSFEGLPVADADGIPYVYSIKASLPGFEGHIIDYGESLRDSETGYYVQNAVFIMPEKPVSAEIPVALSLHGKDPSEISEAFTFILQNEDDPGAQPQVLILDRNNGFKGVFKVMGVMDSSRKYHYFVRQIQLEEHRDWVCDKTVKTVTLSLRFLNGLYPVAEVDMGGAKQLEFFNVRRSLNGLAVIYLENRIVNLMEGIMIPESKEFDFELFHVFSDGSKEKMGTTAVTDSGQSEFPVLKFEKPGSYRFVVSQLTQDIPGWRCDKNEITVTVNVEEAGSGLIAAVDKVPVFTNVFETPVTGIGVSVHWENAKRYKVPVPKSVKVRLLADRSEAGRNVLSGKNGWTCIFPDMPEYREQKTERTNDNMVPVEYAVEAPEVSGFTQRVTGNAKEGFEVVYMAIPPVPVTGDENRPLLWVGMALMSICSLAVLLHRRREN